LCTLSKPAVWKSSRFNSNAFVVKEELKRSGKGRTRIAQFLQERIEKDSPAKDCKKRALWVYRGNSPLTKKENIGRKELLGGNGHGIMSTSAASSLAEGKENLAPRRKAKKRRRKPHDRRWNIRETTKRKASGSGVWGQEKDKALLTPCRLSRGRRKGGEGTGGHLPLSGEKTTVSGGNFAQTRIPKKESRKVEKKKRSHAYKASSTPESGNAHPRGPCLKKKNTTKKRQIRLLNSRGPIEPFLH